MKLKKTRISKGLQSNCMIIPQMTEREKKREREREGERGSLTDGDSTTLTWVERH